MRRGLKQTCAVAGLVGGSYFFSSALVMGAENIGVQAQKLSEDYLAGGSSEEKIDAESRELSHDSVSRLALGVVLLASSAAIAENCYQTRIKEDTVNFADELRILCGVAREEELTLQGLYREVRNEISLRDIQSETPVNAEFVEIFGQVDRT